MKTFFSFIRKLILVTVFLAVHVVLFVHYSTIQEEADTCVSHAKELQVKLDNALIPEESLTAFFSDNLGPRVKSNIVNLFASK